MLMIKPPDFPTIVQIEVNNFCNACCIMCPVSTMKRKHEIMDFALFENVINKIKIEKRDFRGWILPFMSGGPFLVPNYIDYLRLIRKKLPRAKIAVDTNASVLTFETAEKIIDEDLLDLLTISFDGGSKEAYEARAGFVVAQSSFDLKVVAALF
jgi:MoaA/NifB/PqqE/SkfB family radical SAM enzyme